MSKGARNVRYAELDRETENSRVHLVLDLDGGSRCDVATGFATFDEMLRDVATYGSLDFGVSVEAEVGIQDHLVMEDVGTALGIALTAALEDSDPVASAGSAHVPSADALVMCAVDLRARAHLGWGVEFKRDWIAEVATESVREFFETLVCAGRFSLHVTKLAGYNDRHLCEAMFRSLGRSLYTATRKQESSNGGK